MELTHKIEDADLRFAVLSDVHVTHRGQGIEKFTEAVMQLYRMEPRPDALVLSGDIAYQIDKAGAGKADQLYDEPYHMINAVLRRYVDTPVLYANGNHEFGQGRHEEDITQDAIRMFRELGGHELLEHKTVMGYHFITMSIDRVGGYSDEMQARTRAEVEAALAEDASDRPVFLVFHYPVKNTVVGYPKGPHSAEFESWLRAQSRVVCIVGHLHTPVNDPRTIWQEEGGFTIVHAPMCATGNCEVFGCVNHSSSGAAVSQGMLFEVKGSCVYMHKLDFMKKTEVDEPWEVDTAALSRGEGYYYTDHRCENANAPVFAPRTKLLAKDAGEGKVLVDFAKATCRPSGKSQDGFAEFYRFDFTAVRSKAVCASVLLCSDFFVANPSDRFRATVASGLPKGKYVMTVTPVNPFGKEGEALRIKLRLR